MQRQLFANLFYLLLDSLDLGEHFALGDVAEDLLVILLEPVLKLRLGSHVDDVALFYDFMQLFGDTIQKLSKFIILYHFLLSLLLPQDERVEVIRCMYIRLRFHYQLVPRGQLCGSLRFRATESLAHARREHSADL